MKIADVTSEVLGDVWRLNQDAVPHVGSVDLTTMRWFAEHAHYFRVVTLNGDLAGFLVGMRPGLSYGSPNYRWFSENYDDFGYVDRVAVSPFARRLGVASGLYDDFEETLAGKVNVMTCEINIRPPNESSMRYHESHGFVRVGSQETEGGKKEVALMEKKL